MPKKKSLLTFFLFLCVFFALTITASAYKNQWVGNSYYGSDGQKVTKGPYKLKDKNGSNTTYYYIFDSNGNLIKNKLTYVSAKRKYCYSLSNGRLLTTFKRINGNYYYGNQYGYLRTGFITRNNYIHYFRKTKALYGAAYKNALVKIGNYTYYFNKYGRALRGKMATVNNATYYFDKTGHRVNGLQKVGKYYYGFHLKTYKKVTGFRKYNNKWYYLDPNNNGRAVIGSGSFTTIGSNEYYFTSTGQQVRGWLTTGNKTYYMNPKKKGARTYGTLKIGTKTYNFGTKGYITTGATASTYTIYVNRAKNIVTVYEGATAVRAMWCSVGLNGGTPTGTFHLADKLKWWNLNGPSTAQYCSHFRENWNYLFHSVPMYNAWGTHNQSNVRASDYNQLGSAASEGCVRFCVRDAKWIYDNCPIGTTVYISDTAATPLKPLDVGKMTAGTTGKDPTDIWTNP